MAENGGYGSGTERIGRYDQKDCLNIQKYE